ncbi:MAG: four helix bundle protein [Bacteroidales bacterium]|jgi:four helix bundle protein|nr:four helix bundle protein [Bacteroidales bacterium]
MSTGLENLIVYRKAFGLAMSIYEISKTFPKDERYSLTDQIRRSSRAVNANLAEAYAKRKYEPHFISKLTDADMENSETQVWLSFAFSCKYIELEFYDNSNRTSQEIGNLLNYMMKNPKKFSITR